MLLSLLEFYSFKYEGPQLMNSNSNNNNSNNNNNNNNILYLVVPCYNEEEILPSTATVLKNKLQNLIKKNKISENSKIMFVNDGSNDDTWNIIQNLNSADKIFTGISLSKNTGHQNALLAGLLTAKQRCDFTISLDADLQDDVNAIDEMVEKYLNGCDIVYGIRSSRQTDSFFKKTTANLFYKLMNSLGAKTIYNHADFRLMNKKSLNALEKFKEVNLFLRGMVPLIGFKTGKVFYERKKRKAGISKYTLKKMVLFAIDGISSCSTKLISLIFKIGLSTIVLAFLIPVFCKMFNVLFVDLKWQALVSSLWLLSGLNLIATAVVGLYVGKIYLEVKHRPRYIIDVDLENLE